MGKTYYSLDNEYFRFCEIEEAIEYAFENFEYDGEIIVYEGHLHTEPASYYFRDEVSEILSDAAFDEVGECCDTWPDITNEQQDELNKLIKSVIDQFASKHGLHPEFGLIENVRRRVFVENEYEEYFDINNFEEDTNEQNRPD